MLTVKTLQVRSFTANTRESERIDLEGKRGQTSRDFSLVMVLIKTGEGDSIQNVVTSFDKGWEIVFR